MFKGNKNKPIDPPKITAKRVLILTLPVAILLGILVFLGEVPLIVGLVGYMCILFLSWAIMAGFMTDLQILVDYTKNLSEGKKIDTPEFMSSTSETMEIVNSINKMHNVWNNTKEHKELSISDAAVLDSIPDPLIFLDDNLDIVGSNLNARNLFDTDFKKKKITDIFKDKSICETMEKISSMRLDDASFEYTNSQQDASHFIAKISRLPAKATGGASIIVSLTDITLQKNVEQKQIEFFANASHELKTPLSVISGFVETIQTTAKNDAKATTEFLNIIQNQTKDMTALINDLLSITRLESGIMMDNIKTVDVGNIIDGQKQSLGLKASGKNIVIESEAEKNITINANENDIVQVIRNLLDNAIKYGDEGTNIFIKSEKLGNGQISLTVNNKTQNPIDKNDIKKLGGRFYRTDFVKKNKIVGTGLGLSIVKAVVNLYNGSIKISSDIENGTTFTIILTSQKK